MKAYASSNVRKNLKFVLEEVTSDYETVVVTRSNGENVVMMSESEYNNIMENFRIFSNPTIYNKIRTGVDQLETKSSMKRDLVDE